MEWLGRPSGPGVWSRTGPTREDPWGPVAAPAGPLFERLLIYDNDIESCGGHRALRDAGCPELPAKLGGRPPRKPPLSSGDGSN